MSRLLSWWGDNIGGPWRAVLALICVYWLAVSISFVVRGHVGASLPEDALSVRVDLLQSLALLLAWTSLLGTITVWIDIKFWEARTDLKLADKELDHRIRDLENNPGNLEAPQTIIPDRHLQNRIFDGLSSFVRKAVDIGNQLLGWMFFVCSATLCFYRVRWAMDYAKVETPFDDISVLTVKVSAALLTTLAWSFLVIAVTDRIVYMVWQLQGPIKLLLHDLGPSRR